MTLVIFGVYTGLLYPVEHAEPVLWCIAEIIGWILVPVMFLIIGVAGTLHCLVFGSILRKYHYS